jgi:hypothetical protein
MAKEHTLKVRITTVDRERWEAAAAADHRTLSDWIRMRCEGLPTTSPKRRPK